uniref:Translation initiation factor beta propellor-like domain-containing protein n=1 Tax=Acrobeloides nanus TaxID=290746 RepID=A0A914CY87_9BILA
MAEYTLDSTFASLPRTTRGIPLVLSASPDGRKFVYCNGNTVYIRDIENITDTETYTEHATLTTVAKYAPSGFYMASGDQSGKCRIWDTTQSTHILKAEYPIISGPIRDISWSDDSKRLAIVGEGRERFGHVFLFDTGTSNGNLSGQSRAMTSIDFRPARPYRLVSASEDNTIAIFEGPPFKFKTMFHEHTRFVHCVRYNKDGTLFASAGADGKVVLFEGTEGSKSGELLDENCKDAAHSGGVFGLAWSPCGQKLVTASGDKTLKLWDVPSRKLISVVSIGPNVDDQQLSVMWLKNFIVSVSLSGFVNFIDPETASIARIIKGHNKPITALTLSHDKKYLFTADFEGNITRWSISNGSSERVTPAIHKSQVSGLTILKEGVVASIGWDDTVAYSEGLLGNALDNIRPNSIKLSSQPRGVASSLSTDKVVVVCHKGITVFTKQKQTANLSTNFEATCVAVSPDGNLAAVGSQDSKVRIYTVTETAITEKKVLPHAGAITSVSWSPNGKYLVATDIARKVVPYSVDADYAVASEKDWSFHTARVNCAAWSENNRYIATGGLDTNVIIWDLQHSGEHPIIIKGAHAMSAINGVVWLSDKKILTVGQDANIKLWSVNL